MRSGGLWIWTFIVVAVAVVSSPTAVGTGKGPFHEVTVATYYSHEYSPRVDDEAIAAFGIRDGDPGVRGNPSLYIIIHDEPGDPTARRSLMCHVVENGSELDFTTSFWHYCIKLDPNGEASFLVPKDRTPLLKRVVVTGLVDHPHSPCAYTSRYLPSERFGNYLVTGDIGLRIAYGIDCGTEAADEARQNPGDAPLDRPLVFLRTAALVFLAVSVLARKKRG